MAAQRSRELRYWANLLIGSCLAAVIAALGSLGVVAIQQTNGSGDKRCEIAAQLLQDESPSPYVEKGVWSLLGDLAAKRIKQCLEE